LNLIKDIALARHPVKASKREHILKILDEAFKLVAEHQLLTMDLLEEDET
jgi:hypothetical protein